MTATTINRLRENHGKLWNALSLPARGLALERIERDPTEINIAEVLASEIEAEKEKNNERPR